MRFLACLLPCLALIAAPSLAQNTYLTESAAIFDDPGVAVIHIEIDPAYLHYVLDPRNAESDSLFPARFIFRNSTIAGDTVEPVGFRLRGNTSRYAQKKSFKIDVNEYVRGQKFYALEKLNLNGEHNDPAVLRSRLSWALFNRVGVPSSRTAYAAVHINGEYRGLYVIVEHIDEEFIEARFGNNDGNLYKCLYPADLAYKGSDPTPYKAMRNTRQRIYELKINEEIDDYSDLIDFITFLNLSQDGDFAYDIEERFNVRAFLRYLAVNVLVGSWDDYWYLKNNYYLYHNEATGKFEFIPYDYDNTYGIDFVGGDWATRDLYAFGHPTEPRVLVERILAIPAYRNLYSAYLAELLDGDFQLAAQVPRMDAWHAAARPWVERDPYYPLDWQFTFDDFLNALHLGLGNHVKYGIRPFISIRSNTAREQLRTGTLPAEIENVEATLVDELTLRVRAAIRDGVGAITAGVLYNMPGESGQSMIMYDDGRHDDGAARDGIWATQITLRAGAPFVELYVKAYGSAGAWTIYPATAPRKKLQIPLVVQQHPLVINEFLALNASGLTDEFGQLDDWLEIYNRSDSTVSLAGHFLTDNLANPTKWAFPDTSIPAQSFLLVWVDGDPDQGPLHADFRLSGDGEQAGLFAPLALGNVPIDTLSFGPQRDDVSYGRFPDGGSEWRFFDTPTPGAPNSEPTPVHEAPAVLPVAFRIDAVSPNPAISATTVYVTVVQPGEFELVVYDVLGREIARQRTALAQGGTRRLHLDTVSWAAGVYFLHLARAGAPERQVRKLSIVR